MLDRQYILYPNGTQADTIMRYDANGNMLCDSARLISAIHYNILNLPDTIQFLNGNQIVNLYDAAGRKYKSIIYTVPETAVTHQYEIVHYTFDADTVAYLVTEYAGNIETRYTRTDTLTRRIFNSIGYSEDGAYYHYIKDHLGNICAVVNSTADTLIQSTIYYASGVPMAQSFGREAQPYLYNGKEFVEAHGLNTPFSQYFSQYAYLHIPQKSTTFAAILQNSDAMKRFLILILLAGMAFNMVQAQVVLPPTDPNEACAEAWNKYHKGDILWKTGWGLFVPGVVGTALCSTLGFMTSFTGTPPQECPNPAPLVCWSFMGLSAGAFIASIPCLIVGQVQRKKALKEYNEWNCAPELTCPEIAVNYKKGDILRKTGWGLFGAGCGLIIYGSIVGSRGVYQPGKAPEGYKYEAEKSAYALLGVGCGAVIASFPCIAFGHVQRKAASDLYNTKCASETPLTFSIQSSANGLGLAMQF